MRKLYSQLSKHLTIKKNMFDWSRRQKKKVSESDSPADLRICNAVLGPIINHDYLGIKTNRGHKTYLMVSCLQ